MRVLRGARTVGNTRRVTRRILALLTCALVLASCRVDVAVDVAFEPDGTGTVTVALTADAAVVTEVPSLAGELAFDDVTAAGWTVDGPVSTPDGGLTVTLSNDFVSDVEATNLLNSLGPPFGDMTVTRNTNGEDTTTTITGLLGLPNGFAAFSDEELQSVVGSVPFADRLQAAGATPASSMSAVIRVDLPGSVDDDITNGTRLDDDRYEWTVPLDGSIEELRAVSVQSPGEDRWWARPLSILALVLLVAWVGFMTLFIGYVVYARWRRARRRPSRQPRPPA